MFKKYDIIVVGAGHAGCEAAMASSNMGSHVLLITMNLNTIASMSCNPAMGGIAKGQIVREIDALGGFSGIVTDSTMVQFRMLNRSKGPAMWSPRAQSDKTLFSLKWKMLIEDNKNIDIWQDTVVSVINKGKRIIGVQTLMGHKIYASSVILTNGTFLNGIIHIGKFQQQGGRLGENASYGLTENLNSLGFVSARLKTGTPVRVDGNSINFSKLTEQKGDELVGKFSFLQTPPLANQKSCYLAYTDLTVHSILREGFSDSPMFTGRIEGVGPRYCPSIEDKIERFSDKNSHQLFVEPEGWATKEYYINGFSSSLPIEVQYKALRKISGFENAKILKPGYAIEYDFFFPNQLKQTLETKLYENLYFAGQINGTTGYEEAAAQGIMAGINANLKINNKDPFILNRDEAYIGVLIDDLILKQIDEPYRMFTSRAEYRILLRQDNADLRLTNKAFSIGLASQIRKDNLDRKTNFIEKLINFTKKTSVSPDQINGFLNSLNSSLISQKVKLSSILLRPEVSLINMFNILPALDEIKIDDDLKNEVLEEVEISIKYEGYIEKEKEMAHKLSKYENMFLKDDFDYKSLKSLSFEAREKLSKIKPSTIGQASRISGISPADISVLILYLSN